MDIAALTEDIIAEEGGTPFYKWLKSSDCRARIIKDKEHADYRGDNAIVILGKIKSWLRKNGYTDSGTTWTNEASGWVANVESSDSSIAIDHWRKP